jgi:hypothetical protein
MRSFAILFLAITAFAHAQTDRKYTGQHKFINNGIAFSRSGILHTDSAITFDGTELRIGSDLPKAGLGLGSRLIGVLSSESETQSRLCAFFHTVQSRPTSGGPQGVEGYIYTSNNEGSVKLGIATIGNIEHAGSGNMTYARSLQAGGIVSGNGTIHNLYGLFSTFAITGNGTIDKYYGAYLEPVYAGKGRVNTRFGFYAADPLAMNFFAGSVGIGKEPSSAFALETAGERPSIRINVKTGSSHGLELQKTEVQQSKPWRLYLPAESDELRVGKNGDILGFTSDGKIKILNAPKNDQEPTTLLTRDSRTGEVKSFMISPLAAKFLQADTKANVNPTMNLQPAQGGTYLPTAIAYKNADNVTPKKCNYTLVGNIVTVSGSIQVDCLAPSATTQVKITLPVKVNVSSESNLAGTGSGLAEDRPLVPLVVFGDEKNDMAVIRFFSDSSKNETYFFNFSYAVQ